MKIVWSLNLYNRRPSLTEWSASLETSSSPNCQIQKGQKCALEALKWEKLGRNFEGSKQVKKN